MTFEIIAEMKIDLENGVSALQALVKIDKKVVSAGPVFSGPFSSDDSNMEKLFTLTIQAESAEEALNHILQNYGLIFTNCYYKPAAEPAGI